MFLGALFEHQTPANDGKNPRDFDCQAEMSVRVRKGGFTVKHFDIRIVVPMFDLKVCIYNTMTYIAMSSPARVGGGGRLGGSSGQRVFGIATQ